MRQPDPARKESDYDFLKEWDQPDGPQEPPWGLCVCGRQWAMVGGLRYCPGCNQAVCACIIRQPDGPQEIDLAARLDGLSTAIDRLLDHRTMSQEWMFDELARAYRAQQPEGGAEGEGRA